MAGTDGGRKRWRFRLKDGTTLEVSTPARATEKQVRRRGRVSLVLGTIIAAVSMAAVAVAGHNVNPTSLTFDAIEGGANPGSQTFTFSGPATCTGGSITENGTWLTLNKSVIADDDAVTGGVQTTVTAAVDITGLTSAGSPYSATITIDPTDGQPGPNEPCDSNLTVAVTLNVTAANTPPDADAGGPYMGDEGGEVQLDGAGSSDAEDGDVVSYFWAIAPQTGGANDPDTGASCDFVDGTSSTDAQPKVACTDDGIYDVTLTVEDSEGASDSDTTTLTLDNVAPEITAFACPTDPVAANTPVTLNGSYTDAGSNDSHTASIAWDDGTTTVPSANAGAVSGSHTYTAAGIYTPQLTVTDDDGDSDSQACEYVVVYDPSAGFVTGGGWINSPAGAYLADSELTGKATFGFVSKYKKGANTPDGNTEFQFHAAGLNFKSTAYQWLVVSGSKATYKGWGTINGAGNYGFLLSAVDGSPDKFRIKIWDVATDDAVYDNNLGVGDNAEPATAVGGGSIVIHTGSKK